jgi:hypothetical protein
VGTKLRFSEAWEEVFMAKQPEKQLDFFKAHISGLEFKGDTRWLGICPSCCHREFRVFDVEPVEWRCGRCNLGGFGVKEFIKIMEDHRLPDLRRLAKEAEDRKALGAKGEPSDKISAELREIETLREAEERKQAQLREMAECRDPLLLGGHPKRIGPAVWAWFWLEDHVSGSYKDSEGEWGVVHYHSFQALIESIARDLDQSERSIRNHLSRLKVWGYIRVSQAKDEVHVIEVEAWKEAK